MIFINLNFNLKYVSTILLCLSPSSFSFIFPHLSPCAPLSNQAVCASEEPDNPMTELSVDLMSTNIGKNEKAGDDFSCHWVNATYFQEISCLAFEAIGEQMVEAEQVFTGLDAVKLIK